MYSARKFYSVLVLLIVLIYQVSSRPQSPTTIEVDCSGVPSHIYDQIRSYKPVTDRIIKEIVTGKYAGVTYQR